MERKRSWNLKTETEEQRSAPSLQSYMQVDRVPQLKMKQTSSTLSADTGVIKMQDEFHNFDKWSLCLLVSLSLQGIKTLDIKHPSLPSLSLY